MVSLLIQLLSMWLAFIHLLQEQLILCSQTFIFKADKIAFGTFFFAKNSSELEMSSIDKTAAVSGIAFTCICE